MYDEKSQTYFKSSDFNSLSKLEKTQLKFMKFHKFYKRCKTLFNAAKPKHSNKLSLSGVKVNSNLPSINSMSKTFDNTVLINIKWDKQISIENHTDPSQYNRK